MESQPQNPEFKINPENLHPCNWCLIYSYLHIMLNLLFATKNQMPIFWWDFLRNSLT